MTERLQPHLDERGRPMYWSQRGCTCDYCENERQRVRDVRAYKRRLAGKPVEPYPSLEQRIEARDKVQRMVDAGRSAQTMSELIGYTVVGKGGNYPVAHMLAADITTYQMRWSRYYAIMALDEQNAPLAVSTKRRSGRYTRDIGIVRRLQALSAAGFSLQWVGEQLGTRHLSQFLADPEKKMSAVLAAEIRVLYDRYELRKPEGNPRSIGRVKTAAARKGYAPPMCWDPDTIDDPAAVPQWTGMCGTPAGHKRHERDGSRPCQACRKALYEDQAQRRADRNNGGVRRPRGRPAKNEHGTRSGFHAHKRNKTKPCDACVEANRLYQAAWEAKQKRNPAIVELEETYA